MEELNIGKKLQEFRQEKSMSIREVAQLSGITASMLSQIERGLVNPSINTLKEIAQTLHVPLYLFFKTEPSDEIVVRKDKRKIIGRPEEDTLYALLTPTVTGAIEFCLMEIPTEQETAQAAQSHNGEEVAFVLQGTVDIIVDTTWYQLEEGDTIRIAPHSLHKWVNRGKIPAKVIFAVTPPSF